jgi:hypothetical protein
MLDLPKKVRITRGWVSFVTLDGSSNCVKIEDCPLWGRDWRWHGLSDTCPWAYHAVIELPDGRYIAEGRIPNGGPAAPINYKEIMAEEAINSLIDSGYQPDDLSDRMREWIYSPPPKVQHLEPGEREALAREAEAATASDAHPPRPSEEIDWITSTRATLNRALGRSRTNSGHLKKLERDGVLVLKKSGRQFKVSFRDPERHAEVKAKVRAIESR